MSEAVPLIKIRLHDGGTDSETPWAEPVGPIVGDRRSVRLDNVPFLHAKPTYDDVIEVVRDPVFGVPAAPRP